MILKDFREEIVKTINNSGLSIDAVYFVMKEVLQNVIEAYNQQSQMEDAQRLEEQQAKEEEENSSSSND